MSSFHYLFLPHFAAKLRRELFSRILIYFIADLSDGKRVLGRLIVHDRLTVEAKVLPRYFNHSSFASLRRQLNYFSFVRVGKGRQRESTYINEDVVDLNDILHLKRRPASAGLAINTAIVTQHLETDLGSMESRYVDSIVPVVHLKPHYLGSTAPVKKHAKRQRLTPKLLRCDRSSPPATSSLNNFVSEDEHSETKRHYIALDLTKSSLVSRVDEDDVLAGCSALLGLARRSWE